MEYYKFQDALKHTRSVLKQELTEVGAQQRAHSGRTEEGIQWRAAHRDHLI